MTLMTLTTLMTLMTLMTRVIELVIEFVMNSAIECDGESEL